MHRFALAVLCLICVLAGTAHGQTTSIEPIRAQLGSVQSFHLQTRLNPADKNEVDILPKGTILRVKMLNTVDSSVDRDGAQFHGIVVESVAAGNEVIVHSESEVRGILVLLRSRNHPQGFRYELLVTGVTDHGKNYALTASLNPSFVDAVAPTASSPKPEPLEVPSPNVSTNGKVSTSLPN